MDPQISCILNALDEVKINMKDNDYKIAVEALATLNIDNTKEYILTMAKLMPEMEIGSTGSSPSASGGNEITINVSREMIQSKFKLSSDSLRYIKSLIGSGSISINLSTVPPDQREELEKIKRAIYNISSKNTVTQTLDCHKRGSPCNCLTRKKITHCCSSVILLGISLYDPEPEPEETNEDGDYGATIEFYPNLRLAVAGLRD